MNDSLCFHTIHELHEGYRTGVLDPAALMAALADRTDRWDERLGVYVERYGEEATALAEAASRAFKDSAAAGPLSGVPIALKDLVDLEGRVTQGGSPAHRGRRARATAPIAERLMGAGAIITGKTHSVEMAMGGWGTNEHMGTPWNPWDLEVHRVPGGSSSGSGVAVAAGLVPGAIGTDTGGSVRLPAAFCGLAGLKVTEGTLPLDGIQPLSSTLDTPGPLTRCVLDAALMFDVLTGRPSAEIERDLANRSGPYGEIERPVGGLRLGVLSDAMLNGYDDEVVAFYRASTDCLAGLGATIVPFVLPEGHQDYAGNLMTIIAFEGYRFNQALLEDETALVDRWVRARLAPGKDIDEAGYRSTLARRDEAKAVFLARFQDFDALLTPTTRHPAIPVTEVDETTTPGVTTRIANSLGLCALALPNGMTGSGLPTSLQIICDPGAEVMALRIGRAYEAANDWAGRHPGM